MLDSANCKSCSPQNTPLLDLIQALLQEERCGLEKSGTIHEAAVLTDGSSACGGPGGLPELLS